MVQTINGKPVSDDAIKKLAAEAERGHSVDQLKKRGRKPAGDGPGSVVTVRMDAALLSAVKKRARHDHKNDSEVIRDAVRAWV